LNFTNFKKGKKIIGKKKKKIPIDHKKAEIAIAAIIINTVSGQPLKLKSRFII